MAMHTSFFEYAILFNNTFRYQWDDKCHEVWTPRFSMTRPCKEEEIQYFISSLYTSIILAVLLPFMHYMYSPYDNFLSVLKLKFTFFFTMFVHTMQNYPDKGPDHIETEYFHQVQVLKCVGLFVVSALALAEVSKIIIFSFLFICYVLSRYMCEYYFNVFFCQVLSNNY